MDFAPSVKNTAALSVNVGCSMSDRETVARYNVEYTGEDGGCQPEPHPRGRYILASDYDALLTREAALREQIRRHDEQ